MLVQQDDILTVDDLWNLLRLFSSYNISYAKIHILCFSPGQAFVDVFLQMKTCNIIINLVIIWPPIFLKRLYLTRSVLFSKNSFWKYKFVIRLIWFFINDFSFRTSWQFTAHLNKSSYFELVGFFWNIWISFHLFKKAFNSLFFHFFTLHALLAFSLFQFQFQNE